MHEKTKLRNPFKKTKQFFNPEFISPHIKKALRLYFNEPEDAEEYLFDVIKTAYDEVWEEIKAYFEEKAQQTLPAIDDEIDDHIYEEEE